MNNRKARIDLLNFWQPATKHVYSTGIFLFSNWLSFSRLSYRLVACREKRRNHEIKSKIF